MDHTATSVGFELRLVARHAAGSHPSPGCPLCVDVYHHLRDIAQAVIPTEQRPTRYDIDAFDASFRLSPEAGSSPEVQLVVHVGRRQD